VKKNLETQGEMETVLERLRDMTSQMVLLEERHEEEKKKTASEQKKMKELQRESEQKRADLQSKLDRSSEAHRRSEDDRKKLEAEIKRISLLFHTSQESAQQLQATHKVLEQKFLEASSRLSTIEKEHGSQCMAKSNELQYALKRISDLELENRRLSQRLDQQHLAATATEAQLQLEVQSLEDGLRALQEQYNQLSSQASRLHAENRELSARDGGADQNDILNQRLLSHYRYLVNLTEDQELNIEEPSSDSEWS
jgi:chromosome segregation ATPase